MGPNKTSEPQVWRMVPNKIWCRSIVADSKMYRRMGSIRNQLVLWQLRIKEDREIHCLLVATASTEERTLHITIIWLSQGRILKNQLNPVNLEMVVWTIIWTITRLSTTSKFCCNSLRVTSVVLHIK